MSPPLQQKGCACPITVSPARAYARGGHDACKSLSVRYVEPVIPESDAFSVHPNEKGMVFNAGLVESAMRGQGIS